MVIKTKISEHTKTQQGTKCANGSYLGRTVKGHGEYTFVYGNGSERRSETRHLSEEAAEAYKKKLESAGY